MTENVHNAQNPSVGTGEVRPVPVRPGKIIAVHVAYESRAAQRGRKPAVPSYFIKPASSLAGSGAAVERPAPDRPVTTSSSAVRGRSGRA